MTLTYDYEGVDFSGLTEWKFRVVTVGPSGSVIARWALRPGLYRWTLRSGLYRWTLRSGLYNHIAYIYHIAHNLIHTHSTQDPPVYT